MPGESEILMKERMREGTAIKVLLAIRARTEKEARGGCESLEQVMPVTLDKSKVLCW